MSASTGREAKRERRQEARGSKRDYLMSVSRAWCSLMVLFGLYYFVAWLVTLMENTVWVWIAVITALSIALGLVNEFLRRRGI